MFTSRWSRQVRSMGMYSGCELSNWNDFGHRVGPLIGIHLSAGNSGFMNV